MKMHYKMYSMTRIPFIKVDTIWLTKIRWDFSHTIGILCLYKMAIFTHFFLFLNLKILLSLSMFAPCVCYGDDLFGILEYDIFVMRLVFLVHQVDVSLCQNILQISL